jgi:hypothetical protein
MSDKLIGFNTEYMVYTVAVMVLSSFAYYVYKFWSHRRATIDNNIIGHNIGNQSHESNNNNQGGDPINDQVPTINLYFQFQNTRINLSINTETVINDLINQSLKHRVGLNYGQHINLFFQGNRLNGTDKFSQYNQITNNSVIHAFIVNSSGDNNTNNQQSEREVEIHDPEVVSKYTLFTHGCILIFFTILLYTYKTSKEYFTKNTLLILAFMSIIWLTQFSKTLAKLLLFRRIQ